MSSSWGAKHALVGYDDFRLNMSIRDAWAMLRDESEDRRDWKYKRRRTRLGLLHKMKLDLYHRVTAGLSPRRLRALARGWREERLRLRRKRDADRRLRKAR